MMRLCFMDQFLTWQVPGAQLTWSLRSPGQLIPTDFWIPHRVVPFGLVAIREFDQFHLTKS
jgi:hypothetical protein